MAKQDPLEVGTTSTLEDNPTPFASLTVIGLGLLGGSFAMASRSRYPGIPIFAVDPNSDTRAYARKHQIVDHCFTDISEAIDRLGKKWSHNSTLIEESLASQSVDAPHLVVLACHLEKNLELLEIIASTVTLGSVIVTDIGSCKRAISQKAEEFQLSCFIPAHPMAGKAVSGLENATDLLFVDKGYLICPLAMNQEKDLQRLKGFIQKIGGIPRSLSAEEHDRAMAYVSHLPQTYATLLANLLSENQPEYLLQCFGAGLDDQLRLAASSYAMWGDILKQNNDNIRAALSGLRDQIDAALSVPDSAAYWEQRFKKANETEQTFQKAKKNRSVGGSGH
jgi:prephenate dehydrogenase